MIKVSIITVVYNGGQKLSRAIESVLNQTYARQIIETTENCAAIRAVSNLGSEVFEVWDTGYNEQVQYNQVNY